MKRQLLLKFLFILFILPVHLFSQPVSFENRDITGLWKGSLYNDTTKKNLYYEIAISEERGKLSGYSYTLFDIDGRKEMGVKKIKIIRRDDQLIIEDVELISNDYSEPPPRKVRMQSILNLLVRDTAMDLSGRWCTNRTKEYLPLTGSLRLHRIPDYRPLVLFKKLEELNLDKGLSFVKGENNQRPDIAINGKPAVEIKSPDAKPSPNANTGNSPELAAPETVKKGEVAVQNKSIRQVIKPSEEPVTKSTVDQPKEIAAPRDRSNATDPSLKESVIKRPEPQPVNKGEDGSTTKITSDTGKKKDGLVAAIGKEKVTIQPSVDKPATIIRPPATKKTDPVATVKGPDKKANQPVVETVKKAVSYEKPSIITPPVLITKADPVTAIKESAKTDGRTPAIGIPAEPKKDVAVEFTAPIIPAAANVSERKMSNTQYVFFESDSLVLTLYDNGDVDGDTVSVLMNGQIIFAKQGLSTKANSKTIYVDRSIQDSISMVMYAENLGSIPPNTGLLLIMDGEKRYEVRFSADLKNNAAILLRRKTKEK